MHVQYESLLALLSFVSVIVFIVSGVNAEENASVYWILMLCCLGVFVRSVMAFRRDQQLTTQDCH